jgi:hypothetical protein
VLLFPAMKPELNPNQQAGQKAGAATELGATAEVRDPHGPLSLRKRTPPREHVIRFLLPHRHVQMHTCSHMPPPLSCSPPLFSLTEGEGGREEGREGEGTELGKGREGIVHITGASWFYLLSTAEVHNSWLVGAGDMDTFQGSPCWTAATRLFPAFSG